MDASSSGATEILKTATFSRQSSNVLADEPVTASELLMAAYDPAKLHPLADLGDKLDYLLLDDDKTSDLPGARTAIPSRGWSDDLCYGTGTMYLSGSWHLFQITLSSIVLLFMVYFLLGSIFPYLDIRPSLDFSLSCSFTCSFSFYRLGHRRRLGCARRCPTTPRYLKY